ncbi:uncharacterized protein LOC126373311 isoform X1 [Pectinophora gossypiella]|uniref:uncharacterized protein LOC126373311 isoform X1 n=1 Tax=Pectinophora gossypiella TaxID=13191 RepID=UPI00214E0A5A|nr:uncharacterized protein LOC126373311 isoform X1 [Pectinophora gossypiella]
MAAVPKITRGAKRLLLSRSYSTLSPLWKPDHVVTSPYKDVVIPDWTMNEHVWMNSGKWANKTALICGVTNRSYTYNQLYKYSRTFAANLRTKLKVRTGDVICVMMHNSPEYGVVVLGTFEAGAELTTVNPIYTAHELQRQLLLSKPKIVIGSTETAHVIKEAFKLTKQELPLIVVNNNNNALPHGTISFHELAEEENVDFSVLKNAVRTADDVALLPYSSGTTGLPKGVELTHKNVVVNCVQQDSEGGKLYQDTTVSYQDSVVAVLPFYHIYGLCILMLHKLSVGAKIVTLPRFQPETFLSSLKNQKVSLLYAAPPMVLFLGAHATTTKEHLQSVDKIMCGAAPLPKKDVDRVLEKMNPSANFIQLYGLTETSPLVSAMAVGATNYTSVGFAMANTELKIVDSDLKHLGPNKVGELLIRGPQVMKGYRDNHEATKACISEDGWFRSGDFAFLDESGQVTIADRLKELIKVKGYQVPPAELESVLKEHPAVLDAGVIGIPDARTGEVPKAFVVLKEGHKENKEDILDFVKERVADFKRIKDITFMDSLPKNPSGKLLRRVLKEKYC